MIRHLFKKVSFKKKYINSDISNLLIEITKIATSNEKNLAICIENTGSSFLGIKNATFNLFPNSTIVFPAYYSDILLSESQFVKIISAINIHNFDTVVISTLPVSMNSFVEKLCNHNRVNIIFHGALSELSNDKIEYQLFKIIEMVKSGRINRLGFVKSGLDKWGKTLFDIDCVQLQLKPLKKIKIINQDLNNSSKIKIGIFGNSSFNKNLYNQIAGALAVKNTEIHTMINTKFEDFGFKERIVIHPMLPHPDFIKLMSQMDVNLHLSFSEGMGGQVFTESLSQGIPCLTSFNNEYLKYDDYLLDLLTVKQYENPWEIKMAIEKLLTINKLDLQKRLEKYSENIEKEYYELLKEFLKK